mgnify:CR=1 FL=1
MNDKNDSGTIYFLAGLLLGGLVGAGVGMLVAPDSGEVTRLRLKKESEKVVKKGLDAVDDLQKEKITPAIEKVTQELKTRFQPQTVTTKKITK